mgnify:CR=1 FL=1
MKRHFALPVVIVVSAHAFLLFGFTKPPAAPGGSEPKTKPITPHEPVEVVLDDYTPPDDEAGASGETAAGNPPPSPPVAPERIETTYSIDDFVMEFDLLPPRTITDIVTNIIPGGFTRGDGKGPYSGNGYGGDGIHSVLSLDFEPRARARPAPIYPFALKASGVSGEVLVEFVVDEAGRVLSPRVLRSSHREFEEPTINAVSRWRFEPGTRRSKPVRFKMVVPVKFNLND